MVRRRGRWRPARARPDESSTDIWLEGLALDPLVAFHTIRCYLQHPTLRSELGTEASLSRIRRRDLPGGHRSP